MAIVEVYTNGADSQDTSYLQVAGAAVTNVSYLSQRWIRSDQTANSNAASFSPYSQRTVAQGAKIVVDTFLFAFSGLATPTQRALAAYETTGNRKLYVGTAGKLEYYDSTTGIYHVCSTVLSPGTSYQIAVVRDYTAGSGNASRELVYVNKAVDLDIALTVPTSKFGFYYCGETLGASNPGIYLYFRDFTAYTLDVLTETAYQPVVGFASVWANGSLNQWTKSDAAQDYYQHVDEVPANQTDYLSDNASGGTGHQAEEYLSQRATIGLATTDTVLGVAAGHYYRARADGGTKWSATGGLRQGTNEYWSSVLGACAAWVGCLYPYTGSRAWTPADFDDWQIGVEIPSGAQMNEYCDWSQGVAFVSYYNASMALATPPNARLTRSLRPIRADRPLARMGV